MTLSSIRKITYKCFDTEYLRYFSQKDIEEPGVGVWVTEFSSCPLTHPRKSTLKETLRGKDHKCIAAAMKWYHDENGNDSSFSARFDK